MRAPLLKLPGWHKRWLYASFVILLASGLAWLLLHYGREADSLPLPAEAWLMRVHGLASMTVLMGLGMVAGSHVPAGWRLSAQAGRQGQRRSGLWLSAVLTAVVLNMKIRARGFFRAVYFFPVLLSPVVVALTWKWILQRDGLLNAAITSLGGERILFLVDPSWAMFWIVFVSIWAHMGFYTLILLAGLQAIPADLYEAAEMDATPRWSSRRRISPPSPTARSAFATPTCRWTRAPACGSPTARTATSRRSPSEAR